MLKIRDDIELKELEKYRLWREKKIYKKRKCSGRKRNEGLINTS